MDANTVNGETVSCMNTMLLLSASCQAVVQDDIQQVDSKWYQQLDRELGLAENLVLEWRQSGYLYFDTGVLNAIIRTAQQFSDQNTQITQLFSQISSGGLDPARQQALVSAMTQAQGAVNRLGASIGGYLNQLGIFQTKMEVPHEAMNQIITDVQAAENSIKGEIAVINSHIKELKNHISVDRKAMASAKKTRTKGIIETIFGVTFAPVTGGVSLILAGIGASSISDAEDKITSMQGSISKYQSQIASEQTNLPNDEKTVATLNVLSMSTEIVLTDIGNLDNAMSTLRTIWNTFSAEMGQVISKIRAAKTAQDVIVQQAWWNSGVLEWGAVESSVKLLLGRSRQTHHIRIG